MTTLFGYAAPRHIMVLAARIKAALHPPTHGPVAGFRSLTNLSGPQRLSL